MPPFVQGMAGSDTTVSAGDLGRIPPANGTMAAGGFVVEGHPVSGTTGEVSGRLFDMEWTPLTLN